MASYFFSSAAAGMASCAAIYYTISTSLSLRTDTITSSLAQSSHLLLNPTSPFPSPSQPTPTRLISLSTTTDPTPSHDPRRLPPPNVVTTSFAHELRARWNEDLQSVVHGLGRMDLGEEVGRGWREVKGLMGGGGGGGR